MMRALVNMLAVAVCVVLLGSGAAVWVLYLLAHLHSPPGR